MPGSLVNQSTTVMDAFKIHGNEHERIFETEAYASFLDNHLTAVVEVFEINGKTNQNFRNRSLCQVSSQSLDRSSGCVRKLVSIFETEGYAWSSSPSINHSNECVQKPWKNLSIFFGNRNLC